MRARAWVERTKARWTNPGRTMSSMNRPRPVTRRASSLRRGDWPITAPLRLLYPLRRERQRAQPLAGGVCDAVGDGGGRRALRALAHAQELLVGLVEQDDLDLRHLGEAHDRVIGPRPGGHARLVEAHRFH